MPLFQRGGITERRRDEARFNKFNVCPQRMPEILLPESNLTIATRKMLQAREGLYQILSQLIQLFFSLNKLSLRWRHCLL